MVEDKMEDLISPERSISTVERSSKNMEDEEWKLLDWKTLTMIRLYLTKNVAFNISKETITSCLMGYHERTWLSQAKNSM